MKQIVACSIVALVLGACSNGTEKIDFSPRNDEDDFRRNAEEFIESAEVESQAGTTFTDAECDSPDSVEVGETFGCTAVDSDGATWDFNLVVTSSNAYEITDGAPRP